MDLKDLTPGEELHIFEEGLRSQFWQVFVARFQHMTFTTMGAALGQKAEGRDWLAGKASGMKEAMRYPADRIRAIKTKIEQDEKKAKTPL